MNDLQQYLVEEMVEEYQAGRITRRELLRRATLISGSAAIAGTLMSTLGSAPVAAAPAARPTGRPASRSVQPTRTLKPVRPDSRRRRHPARLPGASASYPTDRRRRADPRKPGPTDHQQDVVRRFAKEGYTALAVDLLSRQGWHGVLPRSGRGHGGAGAAAAGANDRRSQLRRRLPSEPAHRAREQHW